MRLKQIVLVAVATATMALAGTGLAACGGSDDSDNGNSNANSGTTSSANQPDNGSNNGSSANNSGSNANESGASNLNAAGKQVFESAGCSGCHTLAAAGASGTVGPDLDGMNLDVPTVQKQVENGGGPMPAFKDTLSAKQIKDVSEFVSAASK